MTAIMSPEELLAGCRRLHAEGAGRMALTIVRPASAAALLDADAAGDADSAKTLHAVDMFLDSCRVGATLCLRCPRPLTMRNAAAMILVQALRDDASEALMFGVCRRCAAGRTERGLATTAIWKLRQIFPDLRELAVSPAGQA